MSIEKLKEQARRHEQKEEWRKALDLYKKAIEKLGEDDQRDIGLYNRVGDLLVRVGELGDAVEHYERAVALYLDAELPNNAIAVCKKVIRNVPNRHQIYLRMGRIRAAQGFLPDARASFLTFAERAAQQGAVDESIEALGEFAGLAPDDVDVCLFVAEQMASHGRADEAVEHLSRAHRRLSDTGDAERAASVAARVEELAPGHDVTAAAAAPVDEEPVFELGSGVADGGEVVADFGEIHSGGEVAGGEASEAVADAAEEARGAFAEGSFAIEGADDESGPGAGAIAEDDAEGAEADDLPWLEVEPSEPDAPGAGSAAAEPDAGAIELDADVEGASELPLLDVEIGDEEGGWEAGGELGELSDGALDVAPAPTDVETSPAGEGPRTGELPDRSAPGPAAPADAEDGVPGELAVEELDRLVSERPDDVSLRQRMVEAAYLTGDGAALIGAYMGLARALERAGESARARAAYQQVLELDPAHEEARTGLGERAPDAAPAREVAAREEYVDLGSMILEEEGEKSTRFVVAYEEPSGDEDADFARMLSQFKEKVSANLEADDVRAHHDLGTAYMEMGLLEEAVAEFQQALRASPDHLPTYEMLGQTFMEMGRKEHAVRVLRRALDFDFEVEDELLGIYYHLARAYEDVGNTEGAVEFYDRVFALDINFADVTERLRALR